MDLKKEIKLSDLFRRRATAPKAKPPKSPTPFWKKELSLRRRRKSPELVPVADEDWVREQLALAAAAAAAPPPEPEKKASLLKKELSFKRKPKAPKEPKPKKPKTESKPFWKQDISLARKPKAAKEPKAPKAKAPAGAKTPKRLVGLKIGASGLAAARVANNGHAELLQLAREPLEPGVVVGGELRDPDALTEALKGFFRKHKLPRRGIRLGIATNRIGVRTLDVVGITDPKQLANAIRFRAQEALPIPVEEAVLDYRILDESETEEGEPVRRVLLVVAYRELVDRYVAACRKAGLTVVGIDLEAFALLRSLSAPRSNEAEPPEAALVAVAIGHDRSTFAVSDGRVCEFTRVLEWGGAALNVAIARALDAAPSEVEDAKRALSLSDNNAPEGLTPEQAAKARDALR